MTPEELAMVNDFLSEYEWAGLIAPTGGYDENGLPYYNITAKGEQWLKAQES